MYSIQFYYIIILYIFTNNLIYKQQQKIMFSKLINRGYQAQQCQICHTRFNLLKLQRIHKCKRCNKFVCWRCGNNKQKILQQNDKWSIQPHRVCNSCNDQLNKINTMVQQKNIKWAKDSPIAQQWIKNMHQANPNKKVSKQKDYEYHHFLKLFKTNIKNFEQDQIIIQKDVLLGRTDYNVFNYSLKQFFYTIQQNQDKQKIRRNIANVLYAVAARFDQIGYVQGMSGISAFLLCFCSEETAYTIFCDLIQNILPDKFLVRGNYGVNLIGLLAQTHFLKQYFIHIVTNVKFPLISHYRDEYSQQQIQHLRMIVQLSVSKALLSLFVSFLSYSHISFIWKQFSVHRNFQVAQRAFLATIYLRRDQLLSRRSFKQLQQLFQNINYQQFTQAYFDLDIDPQIKKKLIQQFYQSLNKKWSNNSQHNIKQLHRYTNFTEDQIKFLQNKFINNSQVKDKQKQSRSTSIVSNINMGTNTSLMIQKGVINKQQFILLIKCYYQILKQMTQQQAPILQITSFFVSKIFDNFITNKSVHRISTISRQSTLQQKLTSSISPQQNSQKNNTSYLDFRQFVCCFSLCTKSLLKDRMCAILNTFEDRNKKISYYSFQKLIINLCQISPQDILDKKQAFLQRMNKYFHNQQQQGIAINQLYILLNDNFINQLTMYIRSDAPGIIQNTVNRYFDIKEGKSVSTTKG